QVVWLGVAFEGSLAGMAWLLGWWLGRPALDSFRWDLWDAGLGVATGLVMVLAFFAMIRCPWDPLVRMRLFFDRVVRPLFQTCTLLDLTLISVLAGLGEEMLFRGVIQAVVDDWFGRWPALIVASLLFGLVHPITPTYMIVAALFGAYLGWVWLVSANLLVVIIAHALYDLIVLIYLLRGRPAQPVPGL